MIQIIKRGAVDRGSFQQTALISSVVPPPVGSIQQSYRLLATMPPKGDDRTPDVLRLPTKPGQTGKRRTLRQNLEAIRELPLWHRDAIMQQIAEMGRESRLPRVHASIGQHAKNSTVDTTGKSPAEAKAIESGCLLSSVPSVKHESDEAFERKPSISNVERSGIRVARLHRVKGLKSRTVLGGLIRTDLPLKISDRLADGLSVGGVMPPITKRQAVGVEYGQPTLEVLTDFLRADHKNAVQKSFGSGDDNDDS